MSDNAEQDKIKRATFVSGYFKKCIARIRSVAGKTVDVPKYPEKLFGCSPEDLAKWLEVMFPNHTTEDRVMAWRFYGDWHVDHITPMCEYGDLTDINEQCRCFNFNNLQPLWAMDNITKKRKSTRPKKPKQPSTNFPWQGETTWVWPNNTQSFATASKLCVGIDESHPCQQQIPFPCKRCGVCQGIFRKYKSWEAKPKNRNKTVDEYIDRANIQIPTQEIQLMQQPLLIPGRSALRLEGATQIFYNVIPPRG